MNYVKKLTLLIIAVLLTVMTVACLFSCSKEPADVTDTGAGDSSLQSTGDTDTTGGPLSEDTSGGVPGDADNTSDTSGGEDMPGGILYIDGTPISEYAIVYAESVISNGSYVFTEYDFFRLTAEHIASEIERITGCSLDVIPESKGGGEHEILVGPTDSSESAVYKTMDRYEYRNSVSGGKLSVGGGYISTSSTTGLPQPRATFVLR